MHLKSMCLRVRRTTVPFVPLCLWLLNVSSVLPVSSLAFPSSSCRGHITALSMIQQSCLFKRCHDGAASPSLINISPNRVHYSSRLGATKNADQNKKTANTIVLRFLRNLWKGISVPYIPFYKKVFPRSDDKNSTAAMPSTSVRDALWGIVVYLLVGLFAYSFVLESKWSVLDALYFSVTTFTTVGYGDLSSPLSAKAKIFTCLFGLGGITFLGTALASIGSNLLQSEVSAMEAAQRTSRQGIVQMFDKMNQIVNRTRTGEEEGTWNETAELTEATQEGEESSAGSTRDATTAATTLETSSSASWRETIRQVVRRVVPSLTVLLLGGVWMGSLEKWSWMDSIYYSIITAGTVGYGDFAPCTARGRLLAILYIPLAVATVGQVLSSIASITLQRRRAKLLESQRNNANTLTMEYLNQMDTNGDGKVSREEYIEFMLVEMQLVEPQQLQELEEQFERLDVTRSGYLDQEDLILMSKLRHEQQEEEQ